MDQLIPLYTAERHYVASVLVPAFDPPPGAIIWGQRVFVRSTDSIYCEVFAYAAVGCTFENNKELR